MNDSKALHVCIVGTWCLSKYNVINNIIVGYFGKPYVLWKEKNSNAALKIIYALEYSKNYLA